MFEVSEHEIETLAKNHGAFIERRVLSSDQGGRSEFSWVQLAVRLPDDGSRLSPTRAAYLTHVRQGSQLSPQNHHGRTPEQMPNTSDVKPNGRV